MMKLLLKYAAIFLIVSVSNAQNPDFQWAKSGGTINMDSGVDVAFDGLGNNYTLFTKYTASYASSLFLVKRSNAGTDLWTKSLSNGVKVQGANMAVDANQNIYIVGKYKGTADFNFGGAVFNMTSNGNDDYFIAKYTSNGSLLWAKGFGGSGDEEVRDIKIDSNGDIVVIGRYMTTVDFDPGIGNLNMTSVGSRDIFIQKLTANGDLVWAKSVGGTGFDSGLTLTIDQNNHIITSGGFAATVDFDPGVGVSSVTSNGSTDIFVLKLDGAGDFVWVKSIGGSNSDITFSIASSSTGNIYLTGDFLGTVDFDPSVSVSNMTSLGSPYDCFVLKLDGNGAYVWSEHFGSPTGHGDGSGIALDANENVYVTGSYDETVDFDPGIGVTNLYAPNEDYFILKLSSSGSFHWAINSGATVPASGNTIIIDDNNNILTTGGFQGTRDFDPTTGVFNLTTNGSYDYYSLMLSQCNSTTFTPDNASLPDVIAQCEVTVLTPPTATSNCSQVFTATHNVTLPITIQGTTVVTWIFDGGNGNISTQTQNVIITDLIAPIFDAANLPSITAECSVTSLTAPTATDNCSGLITGVHNATLPISTQGTTSVLWTYDDGNGNMSTQAQNVVITDITSPVFDVATLTSITDECSVTNLTAPTATDNCSGLITGIHNATLPISNQGTTSVLWTYDDGNGNMSTQVQNVIITPIDNSITQVDTETLRADAASYTYQWIDCDNGNTAILGATNQTFLPNLAGNYACIISNVNCSVTSDCLSSTVGIDNKDFRSTIAVYPNPTNGNVNVKIANNYNFVTITLTDLRGKLIQTEVFNKNQLLNIEVQESAGIYLLHVETESDNAVIKIVKK